MEETRGEAVRLLLQARVTVQVARVRARVRAGVTVSSSPHLKMDSVKERRRMEENLAVATSELGSNSTCMCQVVGFVV